MKIRSLFAATLFSIAIASPALAITEKQKRQIYRAADKNSDKVLDKPEFKTFIRGMAKLGHKKAREAVLAGPAGVEVGFKRVDANRDGWITPQELRKFQ